MSLNREFLIRKEQGGERADNKNPEKEKERMRHKEKERNK
jgi:hypothetical protein